MLEEQVLRDRLEKMGLKRPEKLVAMTDGELSYVTAKRLINGERVSRMSKAIIARALGVDLNTPIPSTVLEAH